MLGHPVVLTRGPNQDFQPLDSVHRRYRGFIQCTVAPPSKLLIPLLPYRSPDKKLLFPLCRSCADEGVHRSCTHSGKERHLHGVWTTVELTKAVDALGYRIVQVDEVYHWDSWSGDLFRGYMNTFFKVKEEASGYPPNCDTPEKQAAYVEEVFAREGVRLDPEAVKYNPGMRQVSWNFFKNAFLNLLFFSNTNGTFEFRHLFLYISKLNLRKK